MKVLNLYAGIGGNRKLWGGDIEVTAVEYNADIAAVYKEFYPGDTVIVGDAHEYLLNHYKEFDIIWSSPPCQSHSEMRICGVRAGQYDAVYPDMKLWQEIIFLQNHAKYNCKFVVENVKPYYVPLVRPSVEIHRHLLWSNAKISNIKIKQEEILGDIHGGSTVFGVSVKDYEMPSIKNKREVLRNMVNPKLGKHIMDCLLEKDLLDGSQGSLF